MEGRYEYRRYVWRDAGIDGVDIGIGAQGAATRTGFDRHITTALRTKTRITGGGFAGVVSMRVRRWRRVAFDASWGNCAIMLSRTLEHSGNPGGAESFSGGNWLSDLTVRSDWALTRAASSRRHGAAPTRLRVLSLLVCRDRHSLNFGIRYAS